MYLSNNISEYYALTSYITNSSNSVLNNFFETITVTYQLRADMLFWSSKFVWVGVEWKLTDVSKNLLRLQGKHTIFVKHKLIVLYIIYINLISYLPGRSVHQSDLTITTCWSNHSVTAATMSSTLLEQQLAEAINNLFDFIVALRLVWNGRRHAS